MFKHTVDALAHPEMADPTFLASLGLASPLALLTVYGCTRAGTSLLSELRNVVFAKVAQGTIRKVGNQVRTCMRFDVLCDCEPVSCPCFAAATGGQSLRRSARKHHRTALDPL